MSAGSQLRWGRPPVEDAAQLIARAHDHLLHGRVEEALAILEGQRERLAKRPEYHAVLASVYGELGRDREAADHARKATELAPRVPEYQFAAALTYFQSGYFTMAHRARRAFFAAGQTGMPGAAELLELEQEYLTAMEGARGILGVRDLKTLEDAAYHMDLGRWALDRSQWADALAASRKSTAFVRNFAPPRNNASLALFLMGRHQEAAREAELVLSELDPNNLHAQANLVRFYLALGQDDRARALGESLAAQPLPDDPESGAKLLEGLALLDRDRDVRRVASRLARKHGRLGGRSLAYQAIAAANLGHRREAEDLLTEALGEGGKDPLAVGTLEALEDGLPGRGISRRYSYSHFSEWLPLQALEEAARLATRDSERGERDERRWAALAERHPQMSLVLHKMLYEGVTLNDGDLDDDDAPTSHAEPILQMLATLRTPAAINTLWTFATGQDGEQSDRMSALRHLSQAGQLGPEDTVKMWIGGKQHDVRPMLQEISPDFMPDYSEEAIAALEAGLVANREGRPDDAERAYLRMLELEPNAKEAANNLAVIYSERGEMDRAMQCLDRAMAIDPTYPFPRVSRALMALREGDMEEAKEWLLPLATVHRWHPLGFANYQMGMAQVAMAEQRYDDALVSVKLALQANPEEAESKRLQEALEIPGLIGGMGNWFEEMDTRYRQRRQRAALPADPTLADCFGLLTTGDMQGIAKVLQLGPVHRHKKVERRDFLLARFADHDFVKRVAGELTPRERSALADVLAHGGVMDWNAFAASYGDDLNERPYMEYHAMSRATVMGRLRARGLLFEGTAPSGLIIAIPRELRQVLQEILGTG